MHNNVRVTPLWLEHLLKGAKESHGVLCPYVAHHEHMVKKKDVPDVNVGGFLATRKALHSLGEFDEKVDVPLLGLDLGLRLDEKGIAVARDPLTVLEYEPALFARAHDLKFFQHQWDEDHLRESVLHMHKKWGLKLQEFKYVEWLRKRKHFLQKRPTDAVFGFEKLPLGLKFPKVSLQKFLQVLIRA